MSDALDQRPLPAPARLRAVPGDLVAGRLALHRLAEDVISPARKAATGRIGLRALPGGFGTPPFGDGEQLRVEGTELVRVGPGGAESDAREPVAGVSAEAATLLAEWFALGASVLLELRAGAAPAADASPVQLWPEHFDIAVELGAEARGARAAYGFSPGDEAHPEPYVYVSTWTPQPPGPLWNATSFPGAELSYASLLAVEDPRAATLAFLRERVGGLERGMFDRP